MNTFSVRGHAAAFMDDGVAVCIITAELPDWCGIFRGGKDIVSREQTFGIFLGEIVGGSYTFVKSPYGI